MEIYLIESAGYFHTDIIMLICALACSVIGIIKRKKFKELRWMFIYPICTSIQTIGNFLFSHIFKIFNDNEYSILANYSINLFLLIEFISIYFFFYKVITIDKIKNVLIGVMITYILIVLSSWYFSKTFSDYPFDLFFIQALFVLILAIICLFDLFKNIPKRNLLNEPSFWIITGSLLYFLCTLPIYIAKEFIFNDQGYIIEKGMYSINFICYSIFFLLIIRAYLCRPTVH